MTLTPAEKIFFQRMAPFIEAGMSFEDAGRAVLERDQQIVSTVMDWSYSGPTAQSRAEIRSAITAEIYTKIRETM